MVPFVSSTARRNMAGSLFRSHLHREARGRRRVNPSRPALIRRLAFRAAFGAAGDVIGEFMQPVAAPGAEVMAVSARRAVDAGGVSPSEEDRAAENQAKENAEEKAGSAGKAEGEASEAEGEGDDLGKLPEKEHETDTEAGVEQVDEDVPAVRTPQPAGIAMNGAALFFRQRKLGVEVGWPEDDAHGVVIYIGARGGRG